MESKEGAGETLARDGKRIRSGRVLRLPEGTRAERHAILGIERKTLYRKLERMKL